MFDDLKPGDSDAEHPDLDDAQAWRRYVEYWNDSLLAGPGLYSVAARPGVESQTMSMGGVTVYVATPHRMAEHCKGRVYLEMHPGGLIIGGGECARRGSLLMAERLGVKTISIDYRVPPDGPYPAALDDCVAVYREALARHRPSDVIVGGMSAGGNLAAAMTLRARDEDLPLPAGLVLQSPEADLTESGDTFETLLGVDSLLRRKLSPSIELYAGDHDLRHPYISPLFADFGAGFPSTFLQSGTRDLYLSNTVRLHRALRKAGVAAELHVWEAMPHGGFMGAPEDDEVTAEIRSFMDEAWRRAQP